FLLFFTSLSPTELSTLSLHDALPISGGDYATFIVGFVGALLINALAGKLAQAGCFRAVADAYLGEQINWRSSLICSTRYASATADRKSTRLNSSHDQISYAVFCLKKK